MKSPAAISVRRAVHSDIAALVRLSGQVQDLHVAHEPTSFRPAREEQVSERFAVQLSTANVHVLIAVCDDEPVGYLVATVEERPADPFRSVHRFVEIDQGGVDEAYRKQGVGHALMSAAEGCARAAGIEVLKLNTWSFNEAGKAFFSRMGYEPKVLRMVKQLRNQG